MTKSVYAAFVALCFALLAPFAWAGALTIVSDPPVERPAVMSSVYPACELVDRGGYFNLAPAGCARLNRANARDSDFLSDRIGAWLTENRRESDED